MTETGPYFTTWRPLQHEPFRDPEAIWYPAVQVDRFVAARDTEIAELRKELAETLHALHHHDDCNAVKAARARAGELIGALTNVAKELNEWHQVVTARLAIKCEPGCRTIGILEQARRAIEKGGGP